MYSSGSGTRIEYNTLAIRPEFEEIEARTTFGANDEAPTASHQSLILSAPVYDGRIAGRIRREGENWRPSYGPQKSVVVGIVELGKRFRGIIGPKFPPAHRTFPLFSRIAGAGGPPPVI